MSRTIHGRWEKQKRRGAPFFTAATPGTILRTVAKVRATAKSAVESLVGVIIITRREVSDDHA
jgi:hypothetical protein